MFPEIIDKTLLEQWSSYTKRPSVRVWQTHTRSEIEKLDPKILSGCKSWTQMPTMRTDENLNRIHLWLEKRKYWTNSKLETKWQDARKANSNWKKVRCWWSGTTSEEPTEKWVSLLWCYYVALLCAVGPGDDHSWFQNHGQRTWNTQE